MAPPGPRIAPWLLAAAWVLQPPGTASAQATACRIEPFQGATTPQGAVMQMRVVNTGAACSVSNYGLPAEQANPAYSGAITSTPTHGSAAFVAPQVRYTPAAGYAGDDEFSYEAFAKGAVGQQLRLKVRVKVRIVAP
jgi:hypothetical protein